MAGSKSTAILTMQQAIIAYIEARIPKTPNNARYGIVNGNRVVIGNKSYPYVPTVDLYFGDGSGVYCILPDNGRIAAVVGVD